MNYYLVECDNPTEKLRHYKNSRVAEYTKNELNYVAGYSKYMVTSDDDNITIRLKRDRGFEGVNPLK